MLAHRTTGYDSLGRQPVQRASRAGRGPAGDRTYDGERCSIVTCPAVPAIAGTSVTAVAPLPMTTTFLPA